MEERTIYEQIAERTDGSIYIGVVGPVRTGKSTFIKRFMEQLVLPNIENVYRRERAKDELPQSGSGKTIMTAEPKFVPEEAVEISPDGKSSLSVRLIDTVGYMVAGAIGADEDGTPRMVTTPWFETEIPMTQAAELGTKKVRTQLMTPVPRSALRTRNSATCSSSVSLRIAGSASLRRDTPAASRRMAS